VPIHIPATSVPPPADQDQKTKDGNTPVGGDETRPDDGELGGVALGMQVWDDYERELKLWEAARRCTELAVSR